MALSSPLPPAGVAAGMGALLVLGALSILVLSGGSHELDHHLLSWMQQRRSPTLDAIALKITILGDGATVLAISLIGGLFLWLNRQRLLAALLVLGPPGALLVNLSLKHLFDRPRPAVMEALATHSGPSFPSGHSAAGMVVYVLVGYAALSLRPKRALRLATIGAGAALIPLIGLSRVYLGVHYPSDVLAGFAVGLFWAVLTIIAVRMSERLPEQRPGVPGLRRAP